MESLVLLSAYLKSDLIRDTFGNMRPFFNIDHHDGFIYYRIIIILKMLFTLRSAECLVSNAVAQLAFASSNAYIAFKYPEIAILSATAQCLLLIAPTKKFALFSSMASVCILAMNIKSYEFVLDACVIFSMFWYAYEAYRREFQKLCTVLSIELTMGWYICNQDIFSLDKFLLIMGFLFLAYIPLRPNWHNKHRHRLLYFYALMFLWILYKYQVLNHTENQTTGLKLLNNSQLNKKSGDCEVKKDNLSLVSENIYSENHQTEKLTMNIKYVFKTESLEESAIKVLPFLDEMQANLSRVDKNSNDEMCTADSSSSNTDNIASSTPEPSVEKARLKNVPIIKNIFHEYESEESKIEIGITNDVIPVKNFENLKTPLKIDSFEDLSTKSLTNVSKKADKDQTGCRSNEDTKSSEAMEEMHIGEENTNDDVSYEGQIDTEAISTDVKETGSLESTLQDRYDFPEAKSMVSKSVDLTVKQKTENNDAGKVMTDESMNDSNVNQMEHTIEGADNLDKNEKEQKLNDVLQDITTPMKSKLLECEKDDEKQSIELVNRDLSTIYELECSGTTEDDLVTERNLEWNTIVDDSIMQDNRISMEISDPEKAKETIQYEENVMKTLETVEVSALVNNAEVEFVKNESLKKTPQFAEVDSEKNAGEEPVQYKPFVQKILEILSSDLEHDSMEKAVQAVLLIQKVRKSLSGLKDAEKEIVKDESIVQKDSEPLVVTDLKNFEEESIKNILTMQKSPEFMELADLERKFQEKSVKGKPIIQKTEKVVEHADSEKNSKEESFQHEPLMQKNKEIVQLADLENNSEKESARDEPVKQTNQKLVELPNSEDNSKEETVQHESIMQQNAQFMELADLEKNSGKESVQDERILQKNQEYVEVADLEENSKEESVQHESIMQQNPEFVELADFEKKSEEESVRNEPVKQRTQEFLKLPDSGKHSKEESVQHESIMQQNPQFMELADLEKNSGKESEQDERILLKNKESVELADSESNSEEFTQHEPIVQKNSELQEEIERQANTEEFIKKTPLMEKILKSVENTEWKKNSENKAAAREFENDVEVESIIHDLILQKNPHIMEVNESKQNEESVQLDSLLEPDDSEENLKEALQMESIVKEVLKFMDVAEWEKNSEDESAQHESDVLIPRFIEVAESENSGEQEPVSHESDLQKDSRLKVTESEQNEVSVQQESLMTLAESGESAKEESIKLESIVQEILKAMEIAEFEKISEDESAKHESAMLRNSRYIVVSESENNAEQELQKNPELGEVTESKQNEQAAQHESLMQLAGSGESSEEESMQLESIVQEILKSMEIAELEKISEDESIQHESAMLRNPQFIEVSESESNAEQESMSHESVQKSPEVAESKQNEQTLEHESLVQEEISKEESVQLESIMQEILKSMEIAKLERILEEESAQDEPTVPRNPQFIEVAESERKEEQESMSHESVIQKNPEVAESKNTEEEELLQPESILPSNSEHMEVESEKNAEFVQHESVIQYNHELLEPAGSENSGEVKGESIIQENPELIFAESEQDVENVKHKINMHEEPTFVQILGGGDEKESVHDETNIPKELELEESAELEATTILALLDSSKESEPAESIKLERNSEVGNLMYEEINKLEMIESLEQIERAVSKENKDDIKDVINKNEEYVNEIEEESRTHSYKKLVESDVVENENGESERMYLLINREGTFYVL